MFPWKVIPHPNLILILHYVFLNHLLAPLIVLKKIVLLHQLPKESSYSLLTSNRSIWRNFLKHVSHLFFPFTTIFWCSLERRLHCLSVGIFVTSIVLPRNSYQSHYLVFNFFSQSTYFPFSQFIFALPSHCPLQIFDHISTKTRSILSGLRKSPLGPLS